MKGNPARIWRESKERYQHLGRVGKLVGFTRVMESPGGFELRPYWVGIVDFENGEKTTGQLVGVDGQKIQSGTRVIGVLRRLGVAEDDGVIEYGVKFELLKVKTRRANGKKEKS